MSAQNSQIYIVIAGVAVCVVIYIAWKNCEFDCSQKEGYDRMPLSSIGILKRTPVTYAYQGDGMTNNPHYQADPEDRLVPLEFGGFNPYKRVVNFLKPPLTRDGLQSCKPGEKCDERGFFIVNDSKARRDMAESGDMGWYRVMTNMETPANKPYMGMRPYEVEAIEPDYSQPPLYSGDFHYDAVLGQ
jgi:hypothetical protein